MSFPDFAIFRVKGHEDGTIRFPVVEIFLNLFYASLGDLPHVALPDQVLNVLHFCLTISRVPYGFKVFLHQLPTYPYVVADLSADNSQSAI